MSNKFRQAVNKKVGANVITKGNEILHIERIPTGSLSLDVETGGGIPVGRIVSIVGDWSSGKTAVTLKIAAEFQQKWPDKEIYWVDAEGIWDPKWSKILGIDVEAENFNLVRPRHAQEAFNIILSAIEEGNAGLIVIDSLAALSPKEEVEADMDTVTVALMARLNSRFMRKLKKWEESAGALPPTLIYINQYRVNVGGYGAPMKEPGGEALVYYPSLKIVLKKGDLFDGKKIYKSVTANDEGVEVKAQAIKFYTEKNKTAPWKRRGHFWFYFDGLDKFRPKGCYDRLEEIIRLAKKYDVIIQRSSAYDLVHPDTGEMLTFKGINPVADFIRGSEEWRKIIEKQVMDKVIEDMSGDDIEEEKETRDEPATPEKSVVELKGFDFNEEEGNESSERAGSAKATS